MFYITDNDITESYTNNSETTLEYSTALEILKRRRSSLIKTAYQNEVDGRFSSNATGSIKWYDSTDTDRNNLVGVVACGVDSYYKCYTTQLDSNGQWLLHTIDQLKNVLNDGRLIMIGLIQKRDSKLLEISNATNKEQIVGVVW